ncbi:hypothetical protein [Leisingera caerulea]|uniref:hypothetical protein n=1 Tax=Leisingera caerulea TaxID=506591 RepID=UPI0012B61F06|nr:hypothetical protein [Leisingera caerulea]
MTEVMLSDIFTAEELAGGAEVMSQFANAKTLNASFTVGSVPVSSLGLIRAPWANAGGCSVLDHYEEAASNRDALIVGARRRHFDETFVVVLMNEFLIDGYHHVIAAKYSGMPVRAIDLWDALDTQDNPPGRRLVEPLSAESSPEP